MEGGGGGEGSGGAAVVSAEGAGDHGGVLAQFVQGLLDAAGEHRVGAGLDEDAVALAGQGRDGFVEADGVTQVFVPVGGVQAGAVAPLSRDGREHRQRGDARADGGEFAEQPVVEFLHLGRVGGVVDGHVPGPDALGGEVGDELVQRLGRAGDHGRAGAVHDGEREAAESGRQFLCR